MNRAFTIIKHMGTKHTGVQICYQVCIRAMFVVTLLLAIYVFLGREGIGLIPANQDWIERKLSDALGAQVRFSQARGYWQGFSPLLRFKGLSIYGDRQTPDLPAQDTEDLATYAPSVHVEQLEVRLDVGASILARSPKFSLLLLDGVQIDLNQFWGRLRPGAPAADASVRSNTQSPWQDRFVRAVFQNDLILISNVAFKYKEPSGKVLNLNLDAASLGWKSDHFDFSMDISKPDQWGVPASHRLQVLGQVKGRPNARSQLVGRLFVNLNPQDFDDWVRYVPESYGDKIKLYGKLPLEEAITDIEAQFAAWIEFEGGEITSAHTRLNISDYTFHEAIDAQALPESAILRGRWLKADDGWLLAYELDYVTMQQTQSNTANETDAITRQLRGRIEFSKANLPATPATDMDAWRDYWKFSVEDLSLSELVNWVEFLGLKKRFEPIPLDALQLKGQMNTLQLALPIDVQRLSPSEGYEITPDYRRVKWVIDFADLAWDQHASAPALTGLAVQAWGDAHGGIAHLHSPALTLDWPDWFRKKHKDLQLNLPIIWEKTVDDRWAVRSGLIELVAPDAKAKAMLSFTLPHQSKHTDGTVMTERQTQPLRWIGRIEEADAASTPGYLPIPRVPNGVVSWLDNSLVSGRLLQGDLLFNGQLRKSFPSEAKNRLQMRYQVEEAQLRYANGWPALTGASVDALVTGISVDARVEGGRGADLALTQASVTLVEPQPEQSPVVKVRGQAQADASATIEFLKQSPVNGGVGDLLTSMQASGALDLGISVDIPLKTQTLKNVLSPDVGVSISTDEARLDLQQANLVFNDIAGRVDFSSANGIQAQSLTATLFDKPVSAAISAFKTPTNAKGTRISLRGTLDIDDLRNWRPLVFYHGLEGITDYTAEIEFPQQLKSAEDIEPRLQVTSDLMGIEFQAPEPFSKPKALPRAFELKMPLGEPLPPLELTYDDYFKLSLAAGMVRNREYARGHLRFSGGLSILPEQDKLTLSGHLPMVDLEAWFAYLTSVDWSQRPTLTGNIDAPGEPVNVQPQTPPWYQWIGESQLTFGRVYFRDMGFNELGVRIIPSDDAWDIDVRGSDISGRLHLPAEHLNITTATRSDAPVALDLNALNLDKLRSDVVGSDEVVAPSDAGQSAYADVLRPDFSRWPDLVINVDSVKKGENDWGQWAFELLPQDSGGLLVESLQVNAHGSTLTGQMRWDVSDTQSTTQFNGQATLGNAANLMKNWGFSPTLNSERGQSNFSLTWKGSPFKPDISSLQGPLALKLNEGQLLSVDKASPLKVIGLLNFETLQRRLKLDFSDLYKKGLPYDEIVGDFNFEQGHLIIQAFNMQGPSTQFKSRGQVNLIEGTLDQRLEATVPVSRNLILPAAMTGGLPAAAVVFVIDKALGDELDKLTTFKFTLQGNWEDPEVTRVRVF